MTLMEKSVWNKNLPTPAILHDSATERFLDEKIYDYIPISDSNKVFCWNQ